jgi:hypothetical protein
VALVRKEKEAAAAAMERGVSMDLEGSHAPGVAAGELASRVNQLTREVQRLSTALAQREEVGWLRGVVGGIDRVKGCMDVPTKHHGMGMHACAEGANNVGKWVLKLLMYTDMANTGMTTRIRTWGPCQPRAGAGGKQTLGCIAAASSQGSRGTSGVLKTLPCCHEAYDSCGPLVSCVTHQ